MAPPDQSGETVGANRRLTAGRRSGATSYRIGFPGRDMRPSDARRSAEVPDARSPLGRQVLLAVAGSALLVREVARLDWGEHREDAARRAWQVLGGLLGQLEAATPRMHAELASRNAEVIARMREEMGLADDVPADE